MLYEVITEAFVALFAPAEVTPLSPAEMQHWLREVAALRAQAGELAAATAEAETFDGELGMLAGDLARLVDGDEQPALSRAQDPAEYLHALYAHAERTRAGWARRREQRQQAEVRREQLQADLLVAQQGLVRRNNFV